MLYVGASGDSNVIHWNERVARAVGLPDVIAHGMLTMAEAARVVTDWAGDPGRVESYGVRFSRPVVVPDDDAGATVVVSGTVEEKLDGGRVRVALTRRRWGSRRCSRAPPPSSGWSREPCPRPRSRRLVARAHAARADKDFAESDRLRDEALALGWVVRDTPDGPVVTPRPPYDVLPSVDALPDRSADPDARRCTVALLVDGLGRGPPHLRRGPARSTRRTTSSWCCSTTPATPAEAVHALAQAHPGRVEELHVERAAGWSQARQALVRADVAARARADGPQHRARGRRAQPRCSRRSRTTASPPPAGAA